MSKESAILPLNMVKSEIDENLSRSEALLDAFDEKRSDTAKLAECAENFQQLQGVFEMIALPAASLLAAAMAKACEKSVEQPDELRDELLGKVSAAIVMLVRYLEYVHVYHKGLPELLLDNINDLRKLSHDKAIPESYFFTLDIEESQFSGINPLSQVDTKVRRLRHMYQVGLLGTFRDENLKSNVRMMSRALQRLSAFFDEPASRLLRIFQSGLEAFIDGGVSITKTRKLMLGKIDRQLKRLLDTSHADVTLDEALVLEVVRDCLYLAALAEPASPLLTSIRKEFGLENFDLNDVLIEQEKSLMAGPSAAVIHSVSTALREEIANIKDRLDVIARAGDQGDQVKSMGDDLLRIGHTLTMLGLTNASDRLKQVGDKLQDSGQFDTVIQELADTLVFIERSIEQLEQSHTAIRANAMEQNPENLLELDHVSASVVKETRKLLALVQSALSNFIENDFTLSYMENVVDNLHSAWGAIYFLNIERAATQLQQSANFVSEKVLDTGFAKDSEQLHTLADALASIDYYLEGIEEKKPLGDGALDIAEESLNELGYASVA